MYNLSFPQSFPHMSHSFTWEIKNKVTVRIWQIWLVAVKKKKTETQCAKTATGVNNRKKCVTPVAVVPLPTAAQPFLHVTLLPIFFFLCLSVCLSVRLLASSVSYFLSALDWCFSLAVSHLSACVCASVFSFPPLPSMLHRLQAQVPKAEKPKSLCLPLFFLFVTYRIKTAVAVWERN